MNIHHLLYSAEFLWVLRLLSRKKKSKYLAALFLIIVWHFKTQWTCYVSLMYTLKWICGSSHAFDTLLQVAGFCINTKYLSYQVLTFNALFHKPFAFFLTPQFIKIGKTREYSKLQWLNFEYEAPFTCFLNKERGVKRRPLSYSFKMGGKF